MSLKLRTQTVVTLIGLVCALTASAAAQSSDQNLPTAVRSHEITGTIRALDLGDARLTRHYYAFDGTAGDLIVTLDSKNLNGDVDVFTAVTFRPLMKISMYAESATTQVAKSIYLRSQQILILRVEARSPNDDPGSYHIAFSGSFEPFSGGIPVVELSETNEADTSRQSNVSSVGATIERPTAPVTETNPTEPSGEKTTTTPTPRSTARRTRGRNTKSARNRPAPRRTTPPRTETAKTQTESTETKKPAETEAKPVTPPEEKPTEPTESEKRPTVSAGAHLIIERSDGNRTEHPMSAVRRVVVESGFVVVTLKTGRIERIPLTSVARIAIEP